MKVWTFLNFLIEMYGFVRKSLGMFPSRTLIRGTITPENRFSSKLTFQSNTMVQTRAQEKLDELQSQYTTQEKIELLEQRMVTPSPTLPVRKHPRKRIRTTTVSVPSDEMPPLVLEAPMAPLETCTHLYRSGPRLGIRCGVQPKKYGVCSIHRKNKGATRREKWIEEAEAKKANNEPPSPPPAENWFDDVAKRIRENCPPNPPPLVRQDTVSADPQLKCDLV